MTTFIHISVNVIGNITITQAHIPSLIQRHVDGLGRVLRLSF